MQNMDVLSLLNKDIRIKGVPIKETRMFQVLSDMNVSTQDIDDYSNSLHNLLKEKGAEVTKEKIVTIFRINPLVAVRIVESCSLAADIEVLAYSIKPLFSIVSEGDSSLVGAHLGANTILNQNKVAYVTLLIEAVFQKTLRESTPWEPDLFLSYAYEEDKKLYSKRQAPCYFVEKNIKHILRNIPEERQIEFINWFWNRHCYAAKKFAKKESFASRCVRVILAELQEGALWKHLENVEKFRLSHRELMWLDIERTEMRAFVNMAIAEGRHLDFVKRMLGSDNFYEKLNALMMADYRERYDAAVEAQKISDEQYKLEEQKRAEVLRMRMEAERLAQEKAEYERLRAEELKQRKERYLQLVAKVKKKYREANENPALIWHNVAQEIEDTQISLWNYFQGADFCDVKLMVVGHDWGSTNDNGDEIKRCLKKITSFKKGAPGTKYYLCKNRRLDYSIWRLFANTFQRDIRAYKYPDLFFTEACLGYRAEQNSEVTKEMVVSDIAEFFPEEIAIVQPAVVFCMGEFVYSLIVAQLEKECGGYTEDHEGAEGICEKTFVFNGRKLFVYGMPHCGVAGLKKMPLEEQAVVWNRVKECMAEDGIRLDVP